MLPLMSPTRRRRPGVADDGSAIPEFLGVVILLLTIALAVMQIGLVLYVRNTIISAASEGARYGGRVGVSDGQAAARTADLISRALGDSFAQDVSTVRITENGVQVVKVTVRSTLPLVGPLGPSSLEVSGRAFDESQVAGAAR